MNRRIKHSRNGPVQMDPIGNEKLTELLVIVGDAEMIPCTRHALRN